MNINEIFDITHQDLIKLSQQDDCPAEVFVSLSEENASNAHYYLEKGLENPNLSKKTMYELVETGNLTIIRYLARNINLPDELLEKMIDLEDRNTLNNIVERKNLSKLMQKKIYDICLSSGWYLIISRLIANSPDPYDLVFNSIKDGIDYFDVNIEIWNYISKMNTIKLEKLFLDIENIGKKSIVYKYMLDTGIISSTTIGKIIDLVDQNIFKSERTKYSFEYVINEWDIILLHLSTLKLIPELQKKLDDLFIRVIKYFNKKAKESTNFHNETDERNRCKHYMSEMISKYKNISIDIIKELYKEIPNYITEPKIELLKNERIIKSNKEFLFNVLKTGEDEEIKYIAENYSESDVLAYIILTRSADIISSILENEQASYVITYMAERMLEILNYKYKKADTKSESYKGIGSISIIKSIMSSKISSYFKPSIKKKSDTSLIQSTDELVITNGNKLSIIPEEFDLISQLNGEEIIYGEFPLNASTLEEHALELLYDAKLLKQTQQKYTCMYYGVMHTVPVFTYNGDKYIRIKIKKINKNSTLDKIRSTIKNPNRYIWLKFKPIKWKVNLDNKSLEIVDGIPDIESIPSYELKGYIKVLKEQIFEPYVITEDEKQLKENLRKKEDPKESQKFKLIEKKKEEEAKKKEEEKEYKRILEKFKELKKELDTFETKFLNENHVLSILNKKRIVVPLELLIEDVKDHKEFNKEFIDYLKFIDLSLVSSDNLKVDHIDFSETNMKIDPQKVYYKDLSGCVLADHNLIFASFDGCNLCGTDLSSETESISSIGNAIIDENTKLPKILNEKSLHL